MITWQQRPTPEPAPVPPTRRERPPRRAGMVRALGVAIAALMTANGVVLAEQATNRDLFSLVTDGVGDVREALARAVDPDDGTSVLSGTVEDPGGSSTTTAPPTTTTTAAPAAAADPATSSTTAPPAPSTTATTRKPGKPAAAAPAQRESVEQVVAQLSAYVESQRHLTFKAPVAIVRQGDDDFKASLASMRIDPVAEEARRVQGVYKALGLIEPDVDLPAQVRRLSTGTAPAYYDYRTDQLVVRDGEITPFVKKILVHELTNALHDQHFDIDRPTLRSSSDDSGDAFESLVEGIASRLEARYVADLSEADRQAIDAEQRRLGAMIPRDVPSILLVSFSFPFTAGARLADALGDDRLDAALQAPPANTELVLHPEKYTANEARKPVPDPAADGPMIRSGSLGQLMLSLMFAQVLEAGYAEAVADGWGGDRYVAWEQDGRTCVRLSIDMDSAGDNAELAEGLTDWAAEQPGAVVEGSGPFTVTRCG